MGGMETYCHRFTEELAKSCAVDVIALPGNGDGSAPRPLALFLFAISSAVKLLLRPAAPVCHLGDMAIWPLGWAAQLRHRQTNYVISAHGTDISYPLRGGFLGGLYGLYLRLGSWLMPNMTVIANSRATAEACELFGYDNVQIVSLATDMQAVVPTVTGERNVLFAGRLVKRKGFAWFVKNVLPLLPDDITVQVAGTVWDKNEGDALQHPRVNFLGRLQNDALAQAYADAVCVIVPNIDVESCEFEGFGLVATEAAAAGGVVVAAYHSGLREALLDQVTGFHIAAGDAESWAKQITEIAEWQGDVRTEFCARAAVAVDKNFRWSRVAKATVAIYFRVS